MGSFGFSGSFLGVILGERGVHLQVQRLIPTVYLVDRARNMPHVELGLKIGLLPPGGRR
jgi:hypothetical protein